MFTGRRCCRFICRSTDEIPVRTGNKWRSARPVILRGQLEPAEHFERFERGEALEFKLSQTLDCRMRHELSKERELRAGTAPASSSATPAISILIG